MYNVTIKHKKCATCRWWSGGRKLVFVGANPQFVSVDNISPADHICHAWNVDRGATHQCNRWSKWERL